MLGKVLLNELIEVLIRLDTFDVAASREPSAASDVSVELLRYRIL